jgi:hypothetical protein
MSSWIPSEMSQMQMWKGKKSYYGHNILNWRKKRKRQHKVIISSARMRNKQNFIMVAFLKAPMLVSASCSISSPLRSERIG